MKVKSRRNVCYVLLSRKAVVPVEISERSNAEREVGRRPARGCGRMEYFESALVVISIWEK
jgi:hypothetical protein